MTVKSGFSKGQFQSKHNLKTKSKCVDRRHDSKRRSSKPRSGELITENGKRFILWSDGEKELIE